jgi:hypothetical protein
MIYELLKNMYNSLWKQMFPCREGSRMPKKHDNLVPVVCSKCKVKLCETLPGSSVRCPKCKTWSAADGAKANSVA